MPKEHKRRVNVGGYSRGRDALVVAARELVQSTGAEVGLVMVAPDGQVATYCSSDDLESLLVRTAHARGATLAPSPMGDLAMQPPSKADATDSETDDDDMPRGPSSSGGTPGRHSNGVLHAGRRAPMPPGRGGDFPPPPATGQRSTPRVARQPGAGVVSFGGKVQRGKDGMVPTSPPPSDGSLSSFSDGSFLNSLQGTHLALQAKDGAANLITPRTEKALMRINQEFDALASLASSTAVNGEPSPTSLFVGNGGTPRGESGLSNGRSPPGEGTARFFAEPEPVRAADLNGSGAAGGGSGGNKGKGKGGGGGAGSSNGATTPRGKGGKKADLSILIPENTQKNIVVQNGEKGLGVDGKSREGGVGDTPPDSVTQLKRQIEAAGLATIPSPTDLGALAHLGSPGAQLGEGMGLPTPGFLSGIEWPSPKSLPQSMRGVVPGASATAFDNLVVTGTALNLTPAPVEPAAAGGADKPSEKRQRTS